MRLTDETVNRLQTAARDPATAPEVLTRLVRGSISWIAEMAAANPSLPEQTIIEAVRQAMQRGHGSLLFGLASNPRLPKGVMFDIVRHGSMDCLEKLATNPSADIEVLTAIREADKAHGYTKWRKDTLNNIVQHPACNVNLIRDIFNARVGITPSLMSRCLEYNDLPSDIIDEIARGLYKFRAGRSYSADYDIAIAFWPSREPIRVLIASHPNTSLPLLTLLAMDPSQKVADAALTQLRKHRNADSALLDKSWPNERELAYWKMRLTDGAAGANLSQRRKLIVGAVRKAMRRDDWHLLDVIASNPFLPRSAMFEIIRHGSPASLKELAANPSADIEVLTAIRRADKAHGYTRSRKSTLINIVKHPACNTELIREIFDARFGITPSLMAHCMGHLDLQLDIVEQIAERWQELSERYAMPANRAQNAITSDLENLQNRIVAHPATSNSRVRDVIENAGADIPSDLWRPCIERSDLPSDIIDAVAAAWFKDHMSYRAPKGVYASMGHAARCQFGERILSHPNASLALLTTFAMGTDSRVRRFALEQLQRRYRNDQPPPQEASEGDATGGA